MTFRLNLLEMMRHVLLTESVNANAVMDAIDKRCFVDINYVDEDSNAPGLRLIEPYAYGLTKANNPVLRAYQISGDTLTGKPKWKYFSLDRITSWKPRKQTFNVPPPMQGFDAPDYNNNGDNSMSVVYKQVVFDDDLGDTLSRVKAQNQYLQTAPKMSTKGMYGPIPYANQQRKKNIYTSQPNSQKYAMYRRNVDDTQGETNRFDDDIWAKAEAEKAMQDASSDAILRRDANLTNSGPIEKTTPIKQKKSQKGEEEDNGDRLRKT